MPLLFADLAEETSASNGRTAARLAEEVRGLEQQRGETAAPPDLSRRTVESAEQAADLVAAKVIQVEGIWRGLLQALRKDPQRPDAEQMLESALKAFNSAGQLAVHARALWEMAMTAGVNSDRLGELDAAQKKLNLLIAETTKALKHRRDGWQPSDPARLAMGLQLSKDGKTIKADEAKAWFAPTGD